MNIYLFVTLLTIVFLQQPIVKNPDFRPTNGSLTQGWYPKDSVQPWNVLFLELIPNHQFYITQWHFHGFFNLSKNTCLQMNMNREGQYYQKIFLQVGRYELSALIGLLINQQRTSQHRTSVRIVKVQIVVCRLIYSVQIRSGTQPRNYIFDRFCQHRAEQCKIKILQSIVCPVGVKVFISDIRLIKRKQILKKYQQEVKVQQVRPPSPPSKKDNKGFDWKGLFRRGYH